MGPRGSVRRVLCAVVAMLLPGVDPVSMIIEMVPLVVLYEGSILMASIFGGRSAVTSDPATDH